MCQARFVIFVLLAAFLFKYTRFVQGSVFSITKSVFLKEASYVKHIHIKGNGINDFLAVPVTDGERMKNLFIPNGVILGDYRQDDTSAFTDKENTLIVIRGKYKKCTLRSYELSKVQYRVLDDKDCKAAKKTIVDWWKTNNMNKQSPRVVFAKGYKGLAVVMKERRLDLGCQSYILVHGDGVEGTASVPCETARRMDILNIDRGFVIGDYRTIRVSLVVVDSELYTITGGPTVSCTRQRGVEVQPASAGDCDRVRKMADERLNKQIDPAVEFKIVNKPYMNYEVCYQKIHVRGNGIDDKVSTTCVDGQRMKLVYLAHGFIMGDYAQNDKCLFTDTTGSLTVVTKWRCYRRSRVGGRKHLLVLSFSSCALIKEKIRTILGAVQPLPSQAVKTEYAIYRYRHYEEKKEKRVIKEVCFEEVVIRSRGIDDKVTIDCQNDGTVKNIITQQGFALGDYRRHMVSVFTDNPDSLVVIQGKEKTCYKRSFSGGKTEELTLDQSTCRKVKDDVERAISQSKEKIGTKEDDHVMRFLFERRKREIKHPKNECKETMIVQGNGISSSVQVFCELAQRLDLLLLPKGFVYGDHRIGTSVYSDSPRTMVVIKGKSRKTCTRYMYVESQVVVPMDSVDCNAAMRVVEDYWDSKDKKGFRYLSLSAGSDQV